MSPVAARTKRAVRTTARGAVRPAEFQAALDRALALASEDEKAAPLLAAAGMRMRLVFTDCGLALNVATGEGEDRRLTWSFGEEAGWKPKLELEMDSAVANRYLQGKESLAIAIARGKAKIRGDSRAALLYLPATRLLCEPYRRVVRGEFPDLAAE